MRKLFSTTAAALIASSIAAFAGNTVFVTNIGDLTFPFSPPTLAGAAGAIDNMVIGATTPRAGTFSSINNTGGGALTADSITGTDSSLGITGQAAAQGGAIVSTGGTSSTTGNAGGAVSMIGGTPGATGVGGAVTVRGGIGGATSGAGGQANLAGGAGTAGNANGGSVVIAAGAANGSGAAGTIIERGTRLLSQGAPAAKTVSATLTAAEVLTGIITVNQGAAGASALQLPLATAMDTALPDSAAGDAFDFSVINISTVAAEAASVTTNTGWTLVGDMDFAANSAITTKSAGRLRARKTGTGAWVLYRLS